MSKLNPDFYHLYCEEVKENERLRQEVKRLKKVNLSLSNQLDYLRKNQDKIIEAKVSEAVAKVTGEFENKVIGLEKQVAHFKSVLKGKCQQVKNVNNFFISFLI